MSNALTVQNLPQHLQVLMGNQNLAALNAATAGGISAGNWPRISLKGGRFHLQDPQGQDHVVPHLHLDVVIVDANPNMSKIFYKSGYDPSAEGAAPDCYSDNGVGPSVRASSPQSGTCAGCPNNVWGSKITPTGSQVKACADVKKIAVLLADNTGGPVFELRVPGASLGNLGAYIRALDAAGTPAASIVTRIMFDTGADYPKIMFNAPVINHAQPLPWANYPYITSEMLQDVLEVVSSDETVRCTGKGDTAIDANRVGAAATSVIAANVPPAHQPAGGMPQSSLPPHISGPPLRPKQVGPTPPPNPAFPHAGQPPNLAPPSMPAAAGAPVAKRTRSRKNPEPVIEQANAGFGVPAAPPPLTQPPHHTPPSFLQIGQNAANATAPVHVATTDAALDDMLKKAMEA